MKVLHLIGGGDVGGAKIHVLTLIKELSKSINVKLISLRQGAFADDAKAMGINVEVIRTGNIIKDINKVINLIKTENYDIIHSHGAKANMIGVIAKRFTKVPIVTTVHSDYRLDYLHSKSKMFSFGLINTTAIRFVDYYIGVSQNFKDMLVKRNFNADKIFTVYNGIPFDDEIPEYPKTQFSKKYNIKMDDDDIVIGIIARLHPVKGLGVFLNAAKLVLDKHTNVKFLIAGSGDELKSLQNKAMALEISKNVHFLGWVDNAFEFMSNIDINVLTSLSESFPYVILEGVRVKKPTVSSNVGGLSDLIDSGENGYLFPPGDYTKLSKYLINLIEDSNLRQTMGNKLYEKASKQFSLTNMGNTQLQIYQSILKNYSTLSNTKDSYDVVVSGYYGFKNSGDDAMLMAIIENFKKYKPDIKIMVLSKNPAETRKQFNVNSINRFNLLEVYKVIKKSKLLISGGGNLIQDGLTSTRSLVYYLGVMWLARKLNSKVMIYANGIGPIHKRGNRRLVKEIVDEVDIITLREEESLKELKLLDITKPKIFITADPALTLNPAPELEIDKIMLDEELVAKEPLIGFSLRRLDGKENFTDIIAQIADYTIKKYKATPVFITMQYSKDMPIIKNIVSKMKGKGYILKSKYSVEEMLGIINRMDLVIGMRLHSLIYATRMGVPLIGLAYEPKVEGYLKYINQTSAGNINDLELENLKQLFDDVWNRRSEIREEISKVKDDLSIKAEDNARIALELIKAKS